MKFFTFFSLFFLFSPPSLLLPQIMYNGQPITKLACGAEFSMIMDCKGNLYSFGCPEYGQLGTVPFWGALRKFRAITGLGEAKSFPASVSPSGQPRHPSSKNSGVGAAAEQGVAKRRGDFCSWLGNNGGQQGGHPPHFHPGAHPQGIIRMGNSSPGHSG